MNKTTASIIHQKPAPDWHSLQVQEILRHLEVCPAGLSSDEARQRLQQYGVNLVPAERHDGWFMRLSLQFHNLLIYVLLASALIAALLAHWVDCGVIVGVVLINAIIGVIQEGRAERAMDAIRNMLSLNATVLRDGQKHEIPAEQVTVGDIVLLTSGDKVPADLRLIEVRQLRVDEAALSGESVTVEKGIAPTNAHAMIGERSCMAYQGTLVTYGQARGVVVATGAATEIGHVSELIAKVNSLETPLLRQMGRFGRQLTLIILLLSALTFFFGIEMRGYGWSEMFFATVGIAVAAIPEGLPAIMTIILAIGVQRMARRNAIIRRLPAVETLGSVTVICSDKTGTLTRNEMSVLSMITAEHIFTISGSGYEPQGKFSLDGTEIPVRDYPILSELGRAALLCNDAELHLNRHDASATPKHESAYAIRFPHPTPPPQAGEEANESLCDFHDNGGGWTLSGDPTEGALLAMASRTGLNIAMERGALRRTDTIPFESQHGFMVTQHHDKEGRSFIFLKGAPEKVMQVCDLERINDKDGPLRHTWWQQAMLNAAQQGFRLIAIAMRQNSSEKRELSLADVQHGYTLLGVFALADPPREDAIHAVTRCRTAGIRVKMITGDHLDTACAIGLHFGLAAEGALTGAEIEQMDDVALRVAVAHADIFARASPEHKLRLVQALQANGEVVAMTGDGVNDAPALKRADIGVAMGRKGTEAAKEAAKIVLVDDNFSSIAAAVEEGRTVYDNLRKSIMFVLPVNGGEAMVIVAAILFGVTLPVTPVQILWVNMVTAITLSLALAFEPSESDVMLRTPRDPAEPLLNHFLLWRVFFVSCLMVAGTLGFFLWEQSQGVSLAAARTVAINALVMGEIFYLLNCRYLFAPSYRLHGYTNTIFISIIIMAVLQVLLTYTPLFQRLFDTAAIDATAWWRILLFGMVLFGIVEIEKAVLRLWGGK